VITVSTNVLAAVFRVESFEPDIEPETSKTSDISRFGISSVARLLADYCSYVQGTNNYIYRPDNAKYYKVGNGSSQGSRYNNLPGNNAATAGNIGYRYNYTWSEVWEFMSTGAFAATIGKNWNDIEQTFATASQADTQMTSSCTIAKNRGVVVYTIAFSAPSHAQTLLEGCATSLNNYYDVDTTDIASAFSAIAVSIQKLKLTQ
jgi:hypothetical protein